MTDPMLNTDRCLLFQQGNNGHAVVLLPGLCGSELEMGVIPRLLKAAGYTYAIPSVKGYSAHTGITSYKNWIDEVEQFVTDLMATHSSVSLVGLSMGATLSLAVAARNPMIQSLSILSPVLIFDGWSVPWYYPLLKAIYLLGFRNWHYKETAPFGVKNLEMRKRIKKAVEGNNISELGAAHLPARHLIESLKLIKETKKELPSVTVDILIIHAIDDETASPKNPDLILESISSETRRTIWLGNSYHIITVDNEREIVANETINFIAQSIKKREISREINLNTSSLIIKNRNET
ncbi:carboxylesterase [Polynucleobacter sp. JS-Fieb-80-E5]|uniref:alpha/beta hydrolase n=1 Tax=Polynucleobacter sp. JS-Fieb-80-E5 TaxID=2081050 RepID=UPI001C0C9559|nr:alpha/beta fold hydrolase [Polynucleobacter sp. JS-Fieb-80-E5]MBU3618869.1 alpha/beta fold hydrolase [Polynucleobacter sp. JS-Fieb-80-E5]